MAFLYAPAKSIRETSVNRVAYVAAVLCAGWLAGATAQAAEPPYLSGGIGDDDPLLALSGDYNLQLVFATQGSGEYLADVKVSVVDARDRLVLETVSPGPLFYVSLPNGTYRVSAEFGGKSLRKSVTLGERRQSVHFYWPGSDAPAAK